MKITLKAVYFVLESAPRQAVFTLLFLQYCIYSAN